MSANADDIGRGVDRDHVRNVLGGSSNGNGDSVGIMPRPNQQLGARHGGDGGVESGAHCDKRGQVAINNFAGASKKAGAYVEGRDIDRGHVGNLPIGRTNGNGACPSMLSHPSKQFGAKCSAGGVETAAQSGVSNEAEHSRRRWT